jgi:hypothetical protein
MYGKTHASMHVLHLHYARTQRAYVRIAYTAVCMHAFTCTQCMHVRTYVSMYARRRNENQQHPSTFRQWYLSG